MDPKPIAVAFADIDDVMELDSSSQMEKSKNEREEREKLNAIPKLDTRGPRLRALFLGFPIVPLFSFGPLFSIHHFGRNIVNV